MRAHQSRFQLKLSRHVRLFKNALWHIPFGGMNESSFFLNRQVRGFWPCSMPGVVARSGQTQRRTSKIIGELRGAPHADPAQGALAPPAPGSACHGARGAGGACFSKRPLRGRLRGALAEQAPPAQTPRALARGACGASSPRASAPRRTRRWMTGVGGAWCCRHPLRDWTASRRVVGLQRQRDATFIVL